MFQLFKNKKTYLVVWGYIPSSTRYSDIVKAKDIEKAWREVVKNSRGTANMCYSIRDITNKENIILNE